MDSKNAKSVFRCVPLVLLVILVYVQVYKGKIIVFYIELISTQINCWLASFRVSHWKVGLGSLVVTTTCDVYIKATFLYWVSYWTHIGTIWKNEKKYDNQRLNSPTPQILFKIEIYINTYQTYVMIYVDTYSYHSSNIRKENEVKDSWRVI